MAGKKYFPKKRRGVKSAKGYKKRNSAMGVKSVTKIVKNVMAKNMEVKTLDYAWAPNTLLGVYGGTLFSTNGCFTLSPSASYLNCVQGVASNNRIGNHIKIKSAKMSLMFTPHPYDLTFNPTPSPLVITVVLFYQIEAPHDLTTTLSGFFQNGSSSDNPSLTGVLYDTMKPINKDRYRVFYRKSFKLGHAAYGGTGVNAAAQSYTNNDFKYSQKCIIDYTKYLVKSVKYDDTTVDPKTRIVQCSILISSAGGKVLSNTERAVYMNGCMSIRYTDA